MLLPQRFQIGGQLLEVLAEPVPFLLHAPKLLLHPAQLAGVRLGQGFQLRPSAVQLLQARSVLGLQLLGDAAALGLGAGPAGRKLLGPGVQLRQPLFQPFAQPGHVLRFGLVFLVGQGDLLAGLLELLFAGLDLFPPPFKLLLPAVQVFRPLLELPGRILLVLSCLLPSLFPLGLPRVHLPAEPCQGFALPL